MAEEKNHSSKEARTVVKYLRISPRKVRLVINAIRRKPVSLAFSTLLVLNKKAARIVEKALKSAAANAKVKGLDKNRLFVSEIKADGGPTLKRFMSRAMGKADQLLKRTTHLTLVLEEGERSFAPSDVLEEEKKAGKEKTKKEKKNQAQGKQTRARAQAG